MATQAGRGVTAAAMVIAAAAVTCAETVLVTFDGGNHQVVQYTVADGVWTYEKVFASGAVGGSDMKPTGVTSDGRYVYVGDNGTARRILRFELDGTFVGAVTNFAATCTPECLLAAPNGYLYMSDAFGSEGDRIYRFDLATDEGGLFIATTGWGSTFNNPRGLAIDEAGTLYVADRNTNSVRRFNAQSGTFLNNLATTGSTIEPNGLTYDFHSRRLFCMARQGTVAHLAEIEKDGTYHLLYTNNVTSPRIGVVVIGKDVYYSSYNENQVFRVQPDGTRTVVVDRPAGINNPMYMAVIPDHPLNPVDGLIAHWQFNEPANAALMASSIGPGGYREVEALGYLQSGAEGVEGGAVWFNTYSYGQIRDSASLIPASGDFSLFMWAGAPAGGNNQQRHLFSNNSGQGGRCELGFDFTGESAGKLFWWHTTGPTLISTNTARDGSWHHVGVVRRGNDFELWLDGVMETNAMAASSISQAHDWRIGASVARTFLIQAGASMDDLRVYDRALDSSEVAALFTAYTPSPATLPARPAVPVPDLVLAETALSAVAVAHQPRIAEPIGAPSLLMRPGGVFLATHDVQSAAGLTRVYQSTDAGASWAQLADVSGLVRASLFECNGALYLIGIAGGNERGAIRIHKSTNNGASWSSAIQLVGGTCSLAPGPVAVYDGRVWKAFEDVPGTWPADARARVMSAPVAADLMAAANWTLSDPLSRSGWASNRRMTAWLDGNLVENRGGNLVNLLSVRQNRGGMAEVAALVEVTGAATAPAFNLDTEIAMLPGASKPFTVRYDSISERYWTVTCATMPSENVLGRVLNENLCHRLAVYSSRNLRDWNLRQVLFERSDRGGEGFRATAFDFDGGDLVLLFAAAADDGLHGPRSALEPNLMMFKRVQGFRDLPVDRGEARVLVADTGLNRVMRYSINSLGQWCDDNAFAEGMSAPFGLAHHGELVYVTEQVAGGRLLAYTLRGRFARSVAAFSQDDTPGALTAAPDGTLYVSVVSAVNGDRVVKVNPLTGAVSVFIPTTGWGRTLIDPRGLSCDTSGNVYVAAQFATGNTEGYFYQFAPNGTLLNTSARYDQPRGVFYDAQLDKVYGTVFGSCDVYVMNANLSGGVKNGDFSVATKFHGVGVVDGRICITDYEFGMVHILRDTITVQGTIAAGLKNPAALLLIPEGAAVNPDIPEGTVIFLK